MDGRCGGDIIWVNTSKVDGRTNGRTEGRTNGPTEGRTDGLEGRMNGEGRKVARAHVPTVAGVRASTADRWTNGSIDRFDRRTDRRTDGRTDERTDERTNGRMDR